MSRQKNTVQEKGFQRAKWPCSFFVKRIPNLSKFLAYQKGGYIKVETHLLCLLQKEDSTVACLITAPYDYLAHLPRLSYRGLDFYLFLAQLDFTKQMGTPDETSAPGFYLYYASMIIRHSILT